MKLKISHQNISFHLNIQYLKNVQGANDKCNWLKVKNVDSLSLYNSFISDKDTEKLCTYSPAKL